MNTGNFDTITEATHRCTQCGAKNWNDWFGCVEARLPVKGVSKGVGS